MSEAADIVTALQESLNPLFVGYKFKVYRLHPEGPSDGVAIDFYRLETDAPPEALGTTPPPAFLRIAIDALTPVTEKWVLDGPAPTLKVRALKSSQIRFPSKSGTPLEMLRYVTTWYEHHAGYLKSGLDPRTSLKAAVRAREEPNAPRKSSGPRGPSGQRRSSGGSGSGPRKQTFSPFKKRKGLFEW